MSREKLTEFLWIDRKGSYSFFLKQAIHDFFFRDPNKEIEGYSRLLPYLNMPHARLAQTKVGPILIVRAVEAPSLDKILFLEADRVKESLTACLDDMKNMWRVTKKNYCEREIERNWATESLRTLEKAKDDPRIAQIQNLPLYINGKEYPPLQVVIEKVYKRLKNHKEKNMYLCHGDEHIGNILAVGRSYSIIDPGNYTGFNTVSSVLNNLVGGLYLFEYRYKGNCFLSQNKYTINYSMYDCNEAEMLLKPLLNRVYLEIETYFEPNSLAKEFLFVNELRVALGWVNRSKDLQEIKNNGMLYLGLAVEHYLSDGIV